MKINLNQVVNDHRGKASKFEGEDATLGLLAYASLTTLSQQEQALDRPARLLRGRLAQRIVEKMDGEIDLKAEEVALIKESIGRLFGPWVVAVTEDMLEGAA